jgi:hypothetical protein
VYGEFTNQKMSKKQWSKNHFATVFIHCEFIRQHQYSPILPREKMPTKTYKPRPDGFCCHCGEREATTYDKLFCKKCLRRLIRQSTPNPRTYVGSERLDRKELRPDRFDRAGMVDFDAECSLGGKPDYDAWFPPEEEFEFDDFDF